MGWKIMNQKYSPLRWINYQEKTMHSEKKYNLHCNASKVLSIDAQVQIECHANYLMSSCGVDSGVSNALQVQIFSLFLWGMRYYCVVAEGNVRGRTTNSSVRTVK